MTAATAATAGADKGHPCDVPNAPHPNKER